MRIVFMGTPPFAVPALVSLAAAGHAVVAVYTRAPQPANRGKLLAKSAVHARAEAMGIPVHTPRTLRDPAEHAILAAYRPDIAIVAAYGLLLPQAVLDIPAGGCINLHASLLPRWRGAAPIQRAILAGDAATGITIMRMEAGLDTGPMLRARSTAIDGKTAGELTTELALIGAELITAVLADRPAAVPQPEGATHAPKIDKAEARLDFERPASVLERAVRAFNPAPGAWCEIGGERIKILAASVASGDFVPGRISPPFVIGTGDGALVPTIAQRPGKPAMPVRELLNGWGPGALAQ